MACACVFNFLLLLSSCASSGSNSFGNDTYIGSLRVERTFGHFTSGQAISIDAFGNIYVVDGAAPGIYKFNFKGDSLHAVIAFGKEHDQFDEPLDIDASLTNAVAVADRNNHRIEIYSKDLIWQAGISGHEEGSKIRFGYPLAVRAGSAGNFFIIDGENKRVLSIQPANGSQQVITTSGTESGVAMNPKALALNGNEFITIADANSSSLNTFNNAYLLQSRIRYEGVADISLASSEDMILVLSRAESAIRLFDAATLSYKGSLRLPAEVNHPLAIGVYKGEYFILTKENVVVCSKD
ncbi:MAG: hypothetical protein Q8896_07635 [Bacteroidota bacterium]|nr:hypothetical protein [Bacteroidota bacterium]